MVYQWKPASYIKADAQVAGELCEELSRQGMLTARNLVEVSRPEDAPLHNEFEWNDETAAEKYREYQASHIICCLITKKDEALEPTRAFFTLTKQNAVFETVEAILQEEDKTARLLEMALSELTAFKRKYASLEALAELFGVIEKITA